MYGRSILSNFFLQLIVRAYKEKEFLKGVIILLSVFFFPDLNLQITTYEHTCNSLPYVKALNKSKRMMHTRL